MRSMIEKIKTGQYKVLTLSDRQQWTGYFEKLEDAYKEVFFLPGYYELYEKDNIKAECFIYESEGKIVLYPYLKSEISTKQLFASDAHYYDIEGAYGYNGLAVNSEEPDFLNGFDECFVDYCRKNNIIAEFVRFNPVSANHRLSPFIDTIVMNKNVIVDLNQTENDIWMNSYEHAVRKNVNKAKRNGLTIQMHDAKELPEVLLGSFIDIYKETMDRNKAEDVYYFSEDFYRRICKSLSERVLFIFTLDKDKPVSCELVLLSKRVAYSFLGGTLESHYSTGANNLLKHELILKLKELNFQTYCLGGGQKIDDGIFRYKATFSKRGIVDFYIGKRIHNAGMYAHICQAWEAKFPEKKEKYKNYFLKYKNTNG